MTVFSDWNGVAVARDVPTDYPEAAMFEFALVSVSPHELREGTHGTQIRSAFSVRVERTRELTLRDLGEDIGDDGVDDEVDQMKLRDSPAFLIHRKPDVLCGRKNSRSTNRLPDFPDEVPFVTEDQMKRNPVDLELPVRLILTLLLNLFERSVYPSTFTAELDE